MAVSLLGCISVFLVPGRWKEFKKLLSDQLACHMMSLYFILFLFHDFCFILFFWEWYCVTITNAKIMYPKVFIL